MRVFSSNNAGVLAWGPISSVDVKIGGESDFIGHSWLLVNMTVGAKEIADVRQCFNEVSYIYALGNDQDKCRMSLTFAIFIGRENCKGGENNTKAIKRGIKAYVNDRISKHTSPISVTVGDFSRMAWINGIDIGNVDAGKGICYGTISFIMELDT